jgi:hypothetical protein
VKTPPSVDETLKRHFNKRWFMAMLFTKMTAKFWSTVDESLKWINKNNIFHQYLV